MRTPIAQALAYPERVDAGVGPLELARLGALSFEAPDLGRFPCLALAYDALAAGGTAPALLNAANEVAVAAFLAGRARFTDIAAACAETLARHPARVLHSLDDALAADGDARALRTPGSICPTSVRPDPIASRCVMDILQKLLAFLVVLSVLVVFHELGHYWIARWCGVKVLRFSVGFGRVVWSRRFGPDRTEWAISAIPLGGYVKMADEREGELDPGDVPRAFNRQSVGRRIAIVAAGPIANLILARVPFRGNVRRRAFPGSARWSTIRPAHARRTAGIRAGDLVVGVDGAPGRELAGPALAVAAVVGPHAGADRSRARARRGSGRARDAAPAARRDRDERVGRQLHAGCSVACRLRAARSSTT